MRRAALETGGLTVVSAYLPSVSVGRPCPVLGKRSPPTRNKCSSWAGVPRRAFCHGHVAGLAPQPPPGQLEAARGGAGPLPGGRGVWPPGASPDRQAQRGLAPTRGGAGLPWGVRDCGGHFRACCPRGHAEAPDLYEHGGRSGDHDPSC
jgi:hypothetical protein